MLSSGPTPSTGTTPASGPTPNDGLQLPETCYTPPNPVPSRTLGT